MVVPAVRRADSRQGTAQRYTTALLNGLPARFTTAVGHVTAATRAPPRP
ncbi:hypothetical protein [Streptomyces reniochalinae]